MLRAGVIGPRRPENQRRGDMRTLAAAAVAVICPLASAAAAVAAVWTTDVPIMNRVASSPTKGGVYPVPAGATAPVPGTCRLGDYNSNRSESWIAVKPGTEDLVGA